MSLNRSLIHDLEHFCSWKWITPAPVPELENHKCFKELGHDGPHECICSEQSPEPRRWPFGKKESIE
jgi:hypothetical protein